MFDWLPLSDRKTLPTPRVVFVDLPAWGGYFACRTVERCIDDVTDIDRRDGDLIVLSTHWGDPRPGVLAHEHRHFQQHYLPCLPLMRGGQSGFDFGNTLESWNRTIRRYFVTQPWELDALRYERRLAPDSVNEAMVRATRGRR